MGDAKRRKDSGDYPEGDPPKSDLGPILTGQLTDAAEQLSQLALAAKE